jgi:threonine/homoserine/homoserine lactone efflux protein
MSWHTLGIFLMTNFVLNITPGPAVMLVTSHSLVDGWRRAQFSVLGILSGNALFCLLSAFGLGTLFLRAPALVGIVKGVGALYLVWIGLRALLGSENSPLLGSKGRGGEAPLALYRQALLLQLSNPKSILFFCALLPQFAPSGAPALPYMLALGFCAILLEYPVLCAYTALGAQATRLTSSPRALHVLRILSGGLLLAAAGRVASL